MGSGEELEWAEVIQGEEIGWIEIVYVSMWQAGNLGKVDRERE